MGERLMGPFRVPRGDCVGRLMRAGTLFVVGVVSVTGLSVGPPQRAAEAAPASPSHCDTETATLVGTEGDDVLHGTPGDDVIAGLAGNDVIYGNGGNDLLCGGSGDDELLGGVGDDQLEGGNGRDLLAGSFGDDVLIGGNGSDTLFGGDGNDHMNGANGPDAAGGGSDDDELDDPRGSDRMVGGDGDDEVDGGLGSDSCSAEVATDCEQQSDNGTTEVEVNLVVTEDVSSPVAGELTATVDATADDGLAVVEVYAGDLIVGHQVLLPDGPPTTTSSFTVDTRDGANGSLPLFAVATDVDGDSSMSAAIIVKVDNDPGLEGPTTALTLNEPTRLSDLEPALVALRNPVVEFVHTRQLAEPWPVPDSVRTQAEADGLTVVPGSRALTGGYYGRGLSLAEQLASYRAAYAEDADGEPVIVSLRLAGDVPRADLGPLTAFVDTVTALPARGYETTTSDADTQLMSAVTTPEKSGESQAPTNQMAAAADPDVYWPSYGQLDTREYDRNVERRVCLNLICWPAITWTDTQPRVEFTHDIVWADGVLDFYGATGRAYEHDLKVDGTGWRYGLRPECHGVPESWALYSYRNDVLWESNVPADANPYFDTDLSDECGSADLSVGVVFPERMDDDVPAGSSADYQFRVRTARGDPDDATFRLTAQTVTRDDGKCESWPSSWQRFCTGLNTDSTGGQFILRSGGQLIPDIRLPACFSWSWDPVPPAGNGPEQATRCSGDTDGDGWDDAIDCAPNDPAINPGATEIPNDGVDQNCDGKDLVVGSGVIQVTLMWDNDNDMDLHVYEPDGTHIWYAAPGPTSTGGQLDRDDNVFVCGRDPEPGGVENVYWPDAASPLQGTYRVNVVEYARCAEPANLVVEVRVDGQLLVRRTATGTDGFTFTY